MPNTLVHDDKPSFNNTMLSANDYTRLYAHEGHEVGICSIQYARFSQEDFMSAGIEEITEFKQLPKEQQKFILRETFAEVQKEYGQTWSTGSTACFAAAWYDEKNRYHVTTANLGDSHAMLVILDKNNEVLSAKRLHKLHKPADPDESKRIALSGGKAMLAYGSYRLNCTLAVSRALGDNQYQEEGLSHTPDIDFFDIELKDGEKPFVVVATDGIDLLITESSDDMRPSRKIEDSDVPYIGNVIKEVNHLPVHQIAEKIIKQAAQFLPRDNISALVLQQGSGLGCDGHGGSEVSLATSLHFYSILQKNSKKCLVEPNYGDELKIKFETIDKAEMSRLFAEQERIVLKLSQLEDKLKSLVKEIKQTDECNVSVNELISQYELPKTPCGYVLTFESNVREIHLGIEQIAKKYEATIFNSGQSKFNFHIDRQIPDELEMFIKEVAAFLSQRLIQKDAPATIVETQAAVPVDVVSDENNTGISSANSRHGFFNSMDMSAYIINYFTPENNENEKEKNSLARFGL